MSRDHQGKRDTVSETTRWIADTYLEARKMCPLLNHGEILEVVGEVYVRCKNRSVSENLKWWLRQEASSRKLFHFVSFLIMSESQKGELQPDEYHSIKTHLAESGIEDNLIL